VAAVYWEEDVCCQEVNQGGEESGKENCLDAGSVSWAASYYFAAGLVWLRRWGRGEGSGVP